jgi:hypothetical protein
MNAVFDRWIECRTTAGFGKFSPVDILRDKRKILEPVGGAQDVFSAIRFLTVLAVWADWPDADWESCLDAQRDRFELFGKTPFLQQKSQKPESTVGKLFYEIASGNNVNFHTGPVRDTDGCYVVCPACALRGLLRIPAFVTQGGNGYQSSINNDPPFYALRWAGSLREILSLNLPQNTARNDHPLWASKTHVDNTVREIKDLEAMTFQSRYVSLHKEDNPSGQHCRMCSARSPQVVRSIHFKPGRDKTKVKWVDPFVLRRDGDPVRPKLVLSQEAVSQLLREAADFLDHQDVRVFGLVTKQAKTVGEVLICGEADDVHVVSSRQKPLPNGACAGERARRFASMMADLGRNDLDEIRMAKHCGLHTRPRAGVLYEKLWRACFYGQGKKRQSLAVFLHFPTIGHSAGAPVSADELAMARRNISGYTEWAGANRVATDWAFLLENL